MANDEYSKLTEERKKRADYMREWNRKNPDKVKITREKRKYKLIEWRKIDYTKNAEYYIERQREWYSNHKHLPEYKRKRKERVQLWIEAHPERYKELSRIRSQRRRCSISGAKGSGIDVDRWTMLCDSYNNRCVYCGNRTKLEIDHIVPISKGGLHDLGNIVPACRSCNARKNNKSLLLFLYEENLFI